VPAGQGPFDLAPWLLGASAGAPGGTPAASASVRAIAATPDSARRAEIAGRIATWPAQSRFDFARRATEASLASGMRMSFAHATPSAATSSAPAPPVLGSSRTFHVIASTDGTRFTDVTARLRYVGTHLLVYADTVGDLFGDIQLRALASLMDGDLYAAASGAFGAEPDVDGNGRLIVLFTPVVNSLVRAADCIFTGYVTGFFYPTDEFERLPHSNGGEVLYGVMPDPGAKYSCAHTEADVVRLMQPVFMHEMQHLISFNAHALSRGGATEETWLNEGLSALAEELGSQLFEARYPFPLGRGSLAQIFPDSAGPFISPLLIDAYVYLTGALGHSVTANSGSGSLEEHGAAWLFFRWLADQKGADIGRRLTQTSRTGLANLEGVAGEPLTALFGDFSLALFADSLPGLPRSVVPPRLRFTSRNLRQLMARDATINGFPSPFPLTTYLLSPGGSLRSSMLPGTMMHAILPATSAPATLSFTAQSLTPLAAALGGQVGILRLPP
jgi:hypothetical protein